MMGPVIDELAKDNEGTFKIGKINTDENLIQLKNIRL